LGLCDGEAGYLISFFEAPGSAPFMSLRNSIIFGTFHDQGFKTAPLAVLALAYGA
jgi:hypothetical protein